MKLWERAVLFAPPVAILAASLIATGLDTGTVRLWRVPVHEDGRRDLLETVFYFEHAVRELPLDLVLGIGLAAAMAAFYPRARPGPRPTRWWVWTAFVITVLLIGSVVSVGAVASLQNLSQMPTRPGAPLAWGHHWQYHLLSRLAVLLAGFAAAGLLGDRGGAGSPRPFAATLIGFAALTAIFIPGLEPFMDPLYLGHQARELFTQALVTMPLGLGVCLWLAGRDSSETAPPRRGAIMLCGGAAAAIGAYLAGGILLAESYALRQSPGFVPVVFGHFLESVPTFVVVPLVAGAVYLRLAGAGRGAR